MYSKLRGRMREKGITYSEAADFIGCSHSTFVSRMNGRTSWYRDDMAMMCSLLDIPISELHLYFYTDLLTNR